MADLAALERFGQIDIYLFDQILKGRVAPGMRVLDVGCGAGRNLVYLLREGFEVFGVDQDPLAVESVRGLARRLAPGLPAENFSVQAIEALGGGRAVGTAGQVGAGRLRNSCSDGPRQSTPFEDGWADVVICSAVLHFARDEAHFEAMLRGAWWVLKPGGLFFCRLGSTTGMERQVVGLGGRRFRSPDGSERYLVDDGLLRALTARLDAELVEPLKTTVVHGQRAMSTWVLRKRLGDG